MPSSARLHDAEFKGFLFLSGSENRYDIVYNVVISFFFDDALKSPRPGRRGAKWSRPQGRLRGK